MTEQEEIENLINSLRKDDHRYFIIPDDEIHEVEFRWEYQFESITETDSIFRNIHPDR